MAMSIKCCLMDGHGGFNRRQEIIGRCVVHVVKVRLEVKTVAQKRWRVDVIWRVSTTIELEAESAQAAEQLAYQLDPRDLDDPELEISSITVLAMD